MNGKLNAVKKNWQQNTISALLIGLLLLFLNSESFADSNLPLGIVLQVEGDSTVLNDSQEQAATRGMKLYDGAIVTVGMNSRLVILDLESGSRIFIPEPDEKKTVTDKNKKTYTSKMVRFSYQSENENQADKDRAVKLTLKDRFAKSASIESRDTSTLLTRGQSIKQEILEVKSWFEEETIDYLWALHYLYCDYNMRKEAIETLEKIEVTYQN
ncbi:hypothetical protein KJ966_20765 [bacterium]|nr:hypothetical protein [bacterium]